VSLLIDLTALGLRATGLYGRGVRNALDIRLRDVDVAFPALPASFDGYRLLHLSDFHFGKLPGLTERIIETAARATADLCVMTGDYRPTMRTDPATVLPAVAALRGAVGARDGIVAVLGNHDLASMADPIARLGITVLRNRSTEIARGIDTVRIVGVDDRHYHPTEAGRAALASSGPGYTIALVHSPRYARWAARAGVALYLCGHTHGGQICLPGGIPIVLPRGAGRRRASGQWREGAMQGYTSPGAGVSGAPVRFNCRGEIVRITLRRGKVTG